MTDTPKKVVLLDLDGTLTDSAKGILASVTETFKELGMQVPDAAELQRFVGPPIIDSLRRNHVPDDQLNHGVDLYREYYADRNIFDDPNNPGQKVAGRYVNTVFEGIPQQLAALRADGYYLAVATCKPEYQAMPICDRFRRHRHGRRHLRGFHG